MQAEDLAPDPTLGNLDTEAKDLRAVGLEKELREIRQDWLRRALDR